MQNLNSIGRLSIGTAQQIPNYGIYNTSNKTNKLVDLKQILSFASEEGISCIDTANSYSEAEINLSKCNLDIFDITTKINYHTQEYNIRELVYNSLSKLNLTSIYGILLHDTSILSLENKAEIAREIKTLKDEKIIKNFGISIYGPNEYFRIKDMAHFDIVQIPFNVFDNRAIRSGLLEELNNNGVEVQARSIFLQGSLLNNHRNLPTKLRKFKQNFIDWENWLLENKFSPLQACLSYVARISEISSLKRLFCDSF